MTARFRLWDLVELEAGWVRLPVPGEDLWRIASGHFTSRWFPESRIATLEVLADGGEWRLETMTVTARRAAPATEVAAELGEMRGHADVDDDQLELPLACEGGR